MTYANKFRLPIVALPVAALLAPIPALAAGGSTEPVSVVVPHEDLDLSDPSGFAAFERRIAVAVRKACPVMSRSAGSATHAADCRRTLAVRAAEKAETARAKTLRYTSRGGKEAAVRP